MQMRKIMATTTQRNQVTIPAEVRLAAVSFSLESAYGSVTPSSMPERFDEIARSAKDAKVERTARELREE